MEENNTLQVLRQAEENITPELIAALCKAQSQFTPAIKDADNPFFRSRYAPLDAVWKACKIGLAENGLFVSQPTFMDGDKTMLRTRVYHSSGGFIESIIEVVVSKKNDAQAYGSSLTYFRRYPLSSILGIIVEDDDAEAAMARDNGQNNVSKAPKQQSKANTQQQQQNAPEPAAMTSAQRTTIENILASGTVPQDKVDAAKTWLNNGKNKTLDSAAEMIQKLNAAKTNAKG